MLFYLSDRNQLMLFKCQAEDAQCLIGSLHLWAFEHTLVVHLSKWFECIKVHIMWMMGVISSPWAEPGIFRGKGTKSSLWEWFLKRQEIHLSTPQTTSCGHAWFVLPFRQIQQWIHDVCCVEHTYRIFISSAALFWIPRMIQKNVLLLNVQTQTGVAQATKLV